MFLALIPDTSNFKILKKDMLVYTAILFLFIDLALRIAVNNFVLIDIFSSLNFSVRIEKQLDYQFFFGFLNLPYSLIFSLRLFSSAFIIFIVIKYIKSMIIFIPILLLNFFEYILFYHVTNYFSINLYFLHTSFNLSDITLYFLIYNWLQRSNLAKPKGKI